MVCIALSSKTLKLQRARVLKHKYKRQMNCDLLISQRLSRKGIGAKFEGNTNDFQYPDIIEGDSNGLVGD